MSAYAPSYIVSVLSAEGEASVRRLPVARRRVRRALQRFASTRAADRLCRVQYTDSEPDVRYSASVRTVRSARRALLLVDALVAVTRLAPWIPAHPIVDIPIRIAVDQDLCLSLAQHVKLTCSWPLNLSHTPACTCPSTAPRR